MELTKLLKRLKDEGEKVLTFFQDLEESSWDRVIYTENEEWKVDQILAHFVSVERAFQWLTSDIVSGGTGAPEDFDLDRFNSQQVSELQLISRSVLLKTFRTERNRTLEMTANLSPYDLVKVGNHPWFGQVSVLSLLKLLYRHNQLHIRDIRRTLQKT